MDIDDDLTAEQVAEGMRRESEDQESRIADGRASIVNYLDLSVCYFCIFQTPPSATLPNGQHPTARARALELADATVARFGPHPAALYWQAVIRSELAGAPPPTEAQCLAWVATGATRQPHLHLIALLNDAVPVDIPRILTYAPAARSLHAEVIHGNTTRKRYIRARLAAIFARHADLLQRAQPPTPEPKPSAELREVAAAAERNDDDVFVAIDAYEALITRGEATLDEYLNLIVIYFLFDGGNPRIWEQDGEDSLPDHYAQFQRAIDAWERSVALLDAAQAILGDHPAVFFWRKYIRYMRYYEPEPSEEECRAWVASGETLEPYWHLPYFTTERHDPARVSADVDGARRLHASTRANATARQRYVHHMVRGSLKHAGIDLDANPT